MDKKKQQYTASDIDRVFDYWTKNPIHSLEFSQKPEDKSYFDLIDHIRWSENEFYTKADFYDLPGGPDTRLLDAGCGIGVFTRFYASRGFSVTAFDLTDTALKITKKSLELNNLKADIYQGSVEALPFDDNSFDYIVSNGVIHHTPDDKRAMREFYRVLKPGGKASIAVYYKNWLLDQSFWLITRFFLPLLIKPMKGREKILKCKTSEEFARAYDGNDTPIAKMYTEKEVHDLFDSFSVLKLRPGYFPLRFLRIGLKKGGTLHYFLDRYCGCMIYAFLEKPVK